MGLYGFWRFDDFQIDAALQQSILEWYETQIGKGLPEMQINTTAPMIALALVAGHHQRQDLLATVNDWADALLRDLPRTEEGGFQHVVKEQPNTGQLWDDTLFMTCLFLGVEPEALLSACCVSRRIGQLRNRREVMAPVFCSPARCSSQAGVSISSPPFRRVRLSAPEAVRVINEGQS